MAQYRYFRGLTVSTEDTLPFVAVLQNIHLGRSHMSEVLPIPDHEPSYQTESLSHDVLDLCVTHCALMMTVCVPVYVCRRRKELSMRWPEELHILWTEGLRNCRRLERRSLPTAVPRKRRPRTRMRDLITDFSRNLDTGLLWNLFCCVHRILSTDSLRELPTLLPRYVNREVLTSLIRHLPTFGSWNLFLNLLWNLFTMFLGNLFTLLMVSVSMTFLLVASCALLLVFPVHDSLVYLGRTGTEQTNIQCE